MFGGITFTMVDLEEMWGVPKGMVQSWSFFFFSFNWVIWVSSRDHSVSLGYYMFTLLINFFLSFPFLSFFFLFLLTGDSLIIPPLGTCVNFEKEIVNILWFVILIICPLLVWKTLRMKDWYSILQYNIVDHTMQLTKT